MATVELMRPQYLLVAVSTLSGTLLAYAATDSVSGGVSLSPPHLTFYLSLLQGQLEVLNASYTNLKIGQKVTTTVYRYQQNMCISVLSN